MGQAKKETHPEKYRTGASRGRPSKDRLRKVLDMPLELGIVNWMDKDKLKRHARFSSGAGSGQGKVAKSSSSAPTVMGKEFKFRYRLWLLLCMVLLDPHRHISRVSLRLF